MYTTLLFAAACTVTTGRYPIAEDIAGLRNALHPHLPRHPFPQSLETVEPLYVRPKESCENNSVSGYCAASFAKEADYVVFPLTSEHTAAAVRFAAQHNICLVGHIVPGCVGSLLLETVLLRSRGEDLENHLNLGYPTLSFGSGATSRDASEHAASLNCQVALSYDMTAGLAEWIFSGGPGPLAPSLGLGVDNLLAVDAVLLSGEVIHATESNEYAALLATLRGGGGGAVVTTLYVRAHKAPQNGYVVVSGSLSGDLCEDSLTTVLSEYADFALSLGLNTSLSAEVVVEEGVCAKWRFGVVAVTNDAGIGSPDVGTTVEVLAKLGMGPRMAPVKELHSTAGYYFKTAAATAGVSVARRHLHELIDVVLSKSALCVGTCVYTLRQALTGNLGSPEGVEAVASPLHNNLALFTTTELTQEELNGFGFDV